MEIVVPDLKPGMSNRFQQSTQGFSRGSLILGSLGYKEEIGQEVETTIRVCTLKDPLFFGISGFDETGKKTTKDKRTIPYERVTWLRVFPNEEIGRNAIKRYYDTLVDDSLQTDLGALSYVGLQTIQEYEPQILELLKK